MPHVDGALIRRALHDDSADVNALVEAEVPCPEILDGVVETMASISHTGPLPRSQASTSVSPA